MWMRGKGAYVFVWVGTSGGEKKEGRLFLRLRSGGMGAAVEQ